MMSENNNTNENTNKNKPETESQFSSSISINIPVITTTEKFEKVLEILEFDAPLPPLQDLTHINLQIILEDAE